MKWIYTKRILYNISIGEKYFNFWNEYAHTQLEVADNIFASAKP